MKEYDYDTIEEAIFASLEGASWSEERRDVLIADLVEMTGSDKDDCEQEIQRMCRNKELAEYYSENFDCMMVTYYGDGNDWR